ncbi:MAG TPA: class I SAM-dependent methyltransferase [Verrucomicrobiae bacterium]
MKKIFETAMGVSPALLLRAARFGPHNFGYTSREICAEVKPFEPLSAKKVREQYEAIPVVTLADLVGGFRPQIQLTVTLEEDGAMPLNDRVALLAILVALNPVEVLEIGTFMGNTTRAMAETLETATIHTVDLPPDFSAASGAASLLPKDDFHLIDRRSVGREFRDEPCAERIRQHFGDTAEMDFKQFGKATFFFIDGSHTYEYCKNDSEKCLALCPRGGTFLWHDCDLTHPGVIKCLTEWRQAGRGLIRIDGTALAYWQGA